MYKKKNTLLICFLLLLNVAMAQDITRTNIPEMGISFAVPDGWSATKKDDAYILSSPGFNGFIMLKTVLLHSINELQTAMENGIELQDSTKLVPVEDLKLLGQQGVSGIYQGMIDEQEMTGYLIALMETTKQKTVLCISVSPSDKFNQSNLDYVKILVRSVIFD